MTIRGMDGNGDWYFGQGRNSYFTKQTAIATNVRTRLLLFLGEVFWALDAGVDWWNLIGAKNPSAQSGIILQCQAIILQSYGIVRINSVVPVFRPVDRGLTVTYNVDTLYSRGVVGTLTPVI